MTDTSTVLGRSLSASVNIYPYKVGVTYGFDIGIGEKLWFGWIALVLILTGGALGLGGGVAGKRSIVLIGGLFSVFSISIFAVGLAKELPNMGFLGNTDVPRGLFNFVTVGTHNLSMYLSVGFWLALVSGIIMIVASMLKAGNGLNSMINMSQPIPPQGDRFSFSDVGASSQGLGRKDRTSLPTQPKLSRIEILSF